MGQLGVEHLERNRPIVPEVPREVDPGHATTAQLAFDDVAAVKSFRERVRDVSHGCGPAPLDRLNLIPMSSRCQQRVM